MAAVLLLAAACAREERAPLVTEKTEVLGDIPAAVEGTWFLVANGNVAGDKYRNTSGLYRIEEREGHLEVHQLHLSLPPAIARSLDEANKAFRAWMVTDDQVALVRRSLPTLPEAAPGTLAEVDFKLATPEHYAELLPKQPAVLAASKLALVVDERFKPRPLKPNERTAQLMKNTMVYAIESLDSTKMEGKHLRMTLAAGFVPIPIRMEGPFSMYRVGPAKAGRGFLGGCR